MGDAGWPGGNKDTWPKTCPRPHRPRAESAKTQVPSSLGPTGRPRSIFHAGERLPHAQGGRAAHFTGRHLQWGTGWPRWLAIGDRGGTGCGGGHGAELESWELAFQVPKREPRFLRTARKHTRAQEHSLSNPIPPGFLDSPGGGGYSGERRKRIRSRRRREGVQVEEEVEEERIRRKLQFPR